ncbi:hydroxymethylbilane synthase [Ihubacter sp. mB4P-1]|uniref:hydroxymethylbilane synthase n=1 Tax=Ihubacter sp. mB4P-1 TaxID=3242370 RepID=UPI00137A3176
MKVIVGSRESKLAVIQSEMVIDAIKKYDDTIEVSLLTMKTTGDMILDKTLDKIGGKGLFVKELDKALLDARADLTVHSLKDMPMEVSEQLPLLAFSKREDPRDGLILRKGLAALPEKPVIGSSSLRRKLQLQKLYPEAEIRPIRGNVQTRLAKLDSGEFDAIVLAYAGVKRLGLSQRVSKLFSVEEILPAACQGILAVQGRAGYETPFLADFADEEAKLIALAERSFVRTLDGGCSSPVAAHATICGEEITIRGYYVDADENQFIDQITGDKNQGEGLGRTLALRMKGDLL